MSSGRLIRFLLLLLNLVLLLILLGVWRNAPQVHAVESAPDVPAQPLQLPATPLRNLSLAQYQELLERPLFWSERQALQTAAVEVAAPNQPLAFVLNGVVTSPQSSYALLGKTGGNEVIKAQPGDVVEGWEIESMTKDSVTLHRSGERQQLVLEEERTRER